MKVNADQLKLLAEWLPQSQKINGYTELRHFSHEEAKYVHDAAWRTLKKWFLSDEGQACINDAIESAGFDIINELAYVWRGGKKKRGRCITLRRNSDEIASVWGVTREEAIIGALLDGIGKASDPFSFGVCSKRR